MIKYSYKIKEINKTSNGIVVILEEGGREYTISTNDLLFGELRDDIIKNPGLEVFWSGLYSCLSYYLADVEMRIDMLMSGLRKYVKWFLKGKGEKDTIEGRNDALFLLYENKNEREKRLNAVFAYKGFCEEIKNPLNHEEWLRLLQFVDSGTDGNVRDFRAFYSEMYSLVEGISIFDLFKQKMELEDAVRTVRAIAEGFQQKGIFLATLLSKSEKDKISESLLEKEKKKFEENILYDIKGGKL